MASRVGERGQITIERAIREELGVYAGDRAVQRIEDGRVVIEFVPAPHRRSLTGSLGDKVTRTPNDERWATLRDAAAEAPDLDRQPE
ncbi:MAG: AbrB/MazE/SpoVT family DNA-binding domain-containing protein [Chloroflexi bacterium]|nr:AbrB/MazE/SpoVT family DNA-binding domain-containing protein [Chloroflexota bacterium]